jgi:outer membrane protein
MLKNSNVILILFFVAMQSTTLLAQPSTPGWKLAIGTGFLSTPAFKGSKDYQVSLVPYLRVNYSDLFFASMNEGIGFNVIKNDKLIAGPIARYRFGRKEKDGTSPFHIAGSKTTALQGLGDIDGAIEPGVFANYKFNPFDIEIEVRKGFGGHEGFIGDLSLNYSTMLFIKGCRTILNLGPRTTIVSSDYNQTYYSINPTQSMQSGLRVYDAQGGVLSYGIGASSIVAISKKLSMVLFAGYDRISGEAGNSPLVQQKGSQDQFGAGLFLAYQFGR